MDIYVALHDPAKDGNPGEQSFVIGAFSREELAQGACQTDADDTAEVDGRSAVALEWADAEAEAIDASRYAVVLVSLDVPV